MKTCQLFSKALLVLALLSASALYAQVKVGDNPATINASAILDVESTNKGLLPPRLDIPNLLVAAPVVAPATGLVAYNTNATSGAGLVYWDGTRWLRMQQVTAANNTFVHATGGVYIGDISGSDPGGLSVVAGSQNIQSITYEAGYTGGSVSAAYAITFATPIADGKPIFVFVQPYSAETTVGNGTQIELDNDFGPPLVYGKTTTGFKILITESASVFQNLYFNILVYTTL